jgi:hypothetical protein
MTGEAPGWRQSLSPYRCFSHPQTPASPSRSRAPAHLRLGRYGAVGHPEQRAVDDGGIIAGQVHDSGLDDETAEFDQTPRLLAALDLPDAHVMPRPRPHAHSPSGSRSIPARSGYGIEVPTAPDACGEWQRKRRAHSGTEVVGRKRFEPKARRVIFQFYRFE